MRTNSPMVSVIAPCYNAENYIGRFIDCMLSQSYTDWELILVDDKSTDRTISIIQSKSSVDERIKLYIRDREPKGADTCRNIGQSSCIGKYFIVFDADDYFESFCLEQRVEFMENNPELDYATFRGVSKYEEDEDTVVRKWGEKPSKDLSICFLEADYPFGVWNNIYKSKTMKEHLWDEQLKVYMDFDYLITVALGNYKHAFATNSRPDYVYYLGHSNAITASYISAEKYESTKYLFEKTIDALGENNHQLKAFQLFYLLQYERIIKSNNEEQEKDFYEFWKKSLNSISGKRINYIHKLAKNNRKKKGKLYATNMKYMLLLLFHAKDIGDRIVKKLKR